ncbi:hypothetical protein Xbed_03181 [Xenorhabdus beddingii]|uniref:Uncharacterized protein n=1 Tax=Xenorhabdus beddingii TaxID=40578 RepID=A0A1Y2SHS1_9GAMM|nr:hypothetical protein Xbed_03181 [Xenorhabdus beddingii]
MLNIVNLFSTIKRAKMHVGEQMGERKINKIYFTFNISKLC